jgi:hypothetical protein
MWSIRFLLGLVVTNANVTQPADQYQLPGGYQVQHSGVFENFFEYYNFIFGELELNVKVSPVALVWCCVDPKYSLANKVETSTLEPIMLNIRPSGVKYLQMYQRH